MNPRQTLHQHLGLILAALALLMGLGALGSLGYALALSQRVEARLKIAPPAPVAPQADPSTRGAGSSRQAGPSRAGGPSRGGGPRGGGPVAQLPDDLQKLLKDRPLFGAPQQQQPSLEAILGDSALINGNWVELGKESGGAKLLEINAYGVVIEWQGQRRELKLWNDMPSGGDGGGGMGGPSMDGPSGPGAQPSRGGSRSSPPAGATGRGGAPAGVPIQALPGGRITRSVQGPNGSIVQIIQGGDLPAGAMIIENNPGQR